MTLHPNPPLKKGREQKDLVHSKMSGLESFLRLPLFKGEAGRGFLAEEKYHEKQAKILNLMTLLHPGCPDSSTPNVRLSFLTQ